jgi:hypothetical protein
MVMMPYRIGLLLAALGFSGPLLAQEPQSATDDIPNVVVKPHPGETPSSLREMAISFINDYFRHFSGADALDYFGQHYADHILYYGRKVDRESVMREKERFVRRWPQRLYVARATSINVLCEETTIAVCTITGLVDFDCRSPGRHAVSTGSASFYAGILVINNQPLIISEISTVINQS